MRKKLKDTGGLTMVEMMCAVAILVLLCLMMNTCLGMAIRTYQAITAESEAELLTSTLTDALTDKLRYAVVTAKANGSYKETSVGSINQTVDADGNVKVTVTAVDITDGKITVGGEKLLPDGAYGDGTPAAGGYIGKYMVEQVDASTQLVTYNESTNCFTVKFTVKSEKIGVTKTADFTVRCLNPVKKEGDSP